MFKKTHMPPNDFRALHTLAIELAIKGILIVD